MPTFDDNSLVSQYIRTLENPDSLGYKNGKWYASPYDPNARGFGVDVVKNEEAQKVANGRIGGWLSEEEERDLRNAYINTSSNILDKHYHPYLRKDTLSDSKRMMGIGLLYRGDGINADKELSDAYYNGTDNDFQKAIEQYYKKKNLPERARLHSTFMNSHKPKSTSKQILPTNKWEDMEYKPPLKFSEGGQMETVKLWEELSIPEKAAMMRVAVKNGITNLQDIKREYNEFAKGGPKKKPSVNGNAQRAMDYFMNKGLSQHQAAGLVGNLMRESGMSPTAVNSSSGAYGLAQWLGPRKKALFNKYGNNPTLNQQLDFVWNELNSTHKKGLKALKSSKSAEEAARNAMGYYEFMAGPDAAVREMRKYGQDGEGSMRKGINYASILMGHSPSKSPIVPTTPIAPINPSISQESLESPIPFTPFNPEAFFATTDTYQQPIVVEEPETQEPVAVAISPYNPEEIDRQERMNRLSTFNRILSLTNPYPQEEDSFLSTIGLLTGNTFSKGGGIHIKPSHRGRLTELKKRTGKSEAELYKTGGPAVRKMITFARNARKWKHGLGGNLYDDGGSYSYTKPLDNVYVDSEGNLLDPDVPSARGTVQLPEIIVSTRDPRKPVPTAFSKDLNDAIFNISRHLMQYGRNKSVFAPTNTKFNIIDNEPIESMAQATYLTPRNIQKQKFLEVGYTEAPRDYGLVKKAVGDRNIPVYQKRPDDEKRENLIAIGNIDTEWFGKDRAELRHAGSYPTAVYINPENSKVYQKAWDLNDYGGNTGTAKAYNPMRKLEASVIDKIGSPVVVTSGISEVDNENIRGSLESVLDDFMHNKGLTRYRDYIKEEIPMNNIHGEPMYNPDGTRVYMTSMKPFTYYGLPEVTVYGKMKKGTTYLLTPSIVSKKK